MKIIFLIVLSLYASLTMGQPFVNEQYVKDSLYFYGLSDSAGFYQYQNAKTYEKFALKMMAFAKKKSNPLWIAKALVSHGNALRGKGGRTNIEASILQYKEAIHLFEDLDHLKLLANCYNGLSLCYKDLGYLPEALEASIKSIEILKSVDDTPHKYLGISYGNLANRYIELSLNDMVLKMHDSALHYFEKAEYPFGIYGIYLTKAQVYKQQKKYDKALMLSFQAYEGFNEIKVKQGQITSALGLAQLYRLTCQHREAIRYAKKGVGISGGNKFLRDEACLYREMGENFLMLHQLDSALSCTAPAIRLADSLKLFGLKRLTLDLKARILEQQGDSLAALQIYRLASVAEDSLELRNNISGTTKIIIDKEKEQHRQEVSRFEYISTKNKQWLFISLSTIVLLVAIGVLSIRGWLNSRRMQNQMADTLHDEKERKDEIQRSLVASTAGMAVKDDLLSEVDRLLERIKAYNGHKRLNKNVNEAQKLIKHNLELNETWDDFFTHFEKVHPSFIKQLKFNYNLTSHDLKLCAFIKMNLSYKEISSLLNVSLHSVHQSVSRIKTTKFKLSPETRVFDFLQNEGYKQSGVSK